MRHDSIVMFNNLINQTGISIERLAVLCEIAEAGSIGAATTGNANRQSQFSRQIAELETFFGRDLLDRRARPFRLNEAGRELAQLARMSLSGLEDFLARGKGTSSRLVVGAGESLIQWLLLPAALKAPDKTSVFVFKNLDTTRIIEGLQAGQLDIGLVRQNAIPDGFQVGGSFEYRYRLFVPKRLMPKRLAKTASAFAALPLALMEGRGEVRRLLEELGRDQAHPLTVALECSSYPQIATAIASGHCAGLLPEFAARFLPAEVVMRDLGTTAERKLTRKVSLIWTARTEAMKPLVSQATARLLPKLAR